MTFERTKSSNDLVQEYAAMISRSLMIIEEKSGWPTVLTIRSIINQPDVDIRNEQWKSCINGMKKACGEAEEVLNHFRACRRVINAIMGTEEKHSLLEKFKIGRGPKSSDFNRRLEDINIQKDLNYLTKWWQDLGLKFEHLQESIVGLTSEETLRVQTTLAELEKLDSLYVNYYENVMRMQDILESKFPGVAQGATTDKDGYMKADEWVILD